MQSISERDLAELHDKIRRLEAAARQPVQAESVSVSDAELEAEIESLKNTIAEQAETILSLTAGKQPVHEGFSDPVAPVAPTFDEEGD